MPIAPYQPCDLQHDPLSCFIYPDILNRVDQFLPPVVSEAAQNTVPPSQRYNMQFVINPRAGAGRVGDLMDTFERRAGIEPYLRVVGRPIQTSPSVALMAEKFAAARNGLSWGNPIYLVVMSGDGGTSQVLDALSRLPEKASTNVVVVPISGVGTARDVPRQAGAPSFTERLPHAFMRSVTVPYYGLDVEGDVGTGRHFHSVASGIGGKLFQVVQEVVDHNPFLVRLKKLSSAFGVVPYLVAFVPIYKMVKSGELVTEATVTQGAELLFRGKTCGIITAITPGLGSVTRIPGVDPTHGQAVMLILPENAAQALTTIFEGMWWRVVSMIPGVKVPDKVAHLAADRQIVLGQTPVQVKFSAPTSLEANGDALGNVSSLTMKMADKPVTMMVGRDSVLAKLAGYQNADPTMESVLQMSEFALFSAGLVGAFAPKLDAAQYRDLTHKAMIAMVHGTTLAIMLRNGSPFAYHLRLLNLLPAFLGLQKLSELLPITDKKWKIFANNYLPLAVMGGMQYFRITPTVGNVVRLVAPSTYSSIMGSRLMAGASRHLLGKLATSLYYGAYLGGLAVWLYQSANDQKTRDQTAAHWIESAVKGNDATALAAWVHDTYTQAGAEPEIVAAMESLCQMNREDVDTYVRSTTTPEIWTELDQLATRMQSLNLTQIRNEAQSMVDNLSLSSRAVAGFFKYTIHEDVRPAIFHKSLFMALVHHDYNIIAAAEKPGLFGLAAIMAFHRRHDAAMPPSPPRVIPELLAFLTSDNN